MPMQSWESVLNAPLLGAGAAYASSTTLTDVSPLPQYSTYPLQLAVGSGLRITASGVFSTTATPTLLLGVYYGGVAGVALAATLATTTANNAATFLWRLELVSIVRSVGSAGSIISSGFVDLGTTISAVTHIPLPSVAQATVAIDTTTAKAITLGAQWSANSASNTLTCNQFVVESIN